jgi:hypothetical protein
VRDRVPCEFFLIRYVPDVVKGEFVNIGVLLREVEAAGGDAPPQVQIRFTRDWRRVRCMHADADIGLLEALEQEIAVRLQAGVSVHDPKAVLDVLTDTLSNSVQITEAKATLAENVTTEMEQLMRMYVEPLKGPRIKAAGEQALIGRAKLQWAIRKEFEQTGVWGQMWKKIAASKYTRAGDPLKIDCGYRPNGVIRMFQAVSLAGDVEAAKGLAFSMDALRGGLKRIEAAELDLAAVVEPLRSVAEPGSEAEERYLFGKDTMERQQIRVLTISDLNRAAQTARLELQV